MNAIADNFAIDIGNSSIKVGHFRDALLLEDWVCGKIGEVISIIQQKRANRIIISSVASQVEAIAEALGGFEIFILNASTPIPFESHYTTKNTLGLDRIAAIAGAEYSHSGQDNLIIDIGTCITYDFLDKNKIHHGGSISPGVDMRFKAMHHYTQKLPLIQHYQSPKLIGDSTENALVSGVINGIAAELDGIIGRFQSNWPNLKVIMCGGGLNSFESKLKAPIFASPKLVLIGLNRILEYNEQT